MHFMYTDTNKELFSENVKDQNGFGKVTIKAVIIWHLITGLWQLYPTWIQPVFNLSTLSNMTVCVGTWNL